MVKKRIDGTSQTYLKRDHLNLYQRDCVVFSHDEYKRSTSFTSLILDEYYKRPEWMGGSVALSCEGSQGLNKHLILNLVQA